MCLEENLSYSMLRQEAMAQWGSVNVWKCHKMYRNNTSLPKILSYDVWQLYYKYLFNKRVKMTVQLYMYVSQLPFCRFFVETKNHFVLKQPKYKTNQILQANKHAMCTNEAQTAVFANKPRHHLYGGCTCTTQ